MSLSQPLSRPASLPPSAPLNGGGANLEAEVEALAPEGWFRSGHDSFGAGPDMATWFDRSGNGHDLTPGVTPLEGTDNRGRPCYKGTGTQWGKVSYGLSDAQPNIRAIAFKYDTIADAAYQYPVDGYDAASRNIIGKDSSDNFLMSGGGPITSDFVLDTDWHVAVSVMNGSSSELYLDGVLVAEGGAGSNPVKGLTVLASQSGSAKFEGVLAEVIDVLSSGDIAADVDLLTRYLQSRHGILPMPLDAPVVTVSAIDSATATLTWTASLHQLVTKYFVDYRRAGENEWTRHVSSLAALTTDISGLAADTKYEFMVTPQTALNEHGSPSAIVSATTDQGGVVIETWDSLHGYNTSNADDFILSGGNLYSNYPNGTTNAGFLAIPINLTHGEGRTLDVEMEIDVPAGLSNTTNTLGIFLGLSTAASPVTANTTLFGVSASRDIDRRLAGETAVEMFGEATEAGTYLLSMHVDDDYISWMIKVPGRTWNGVANKNRWMNLPRGHANAQTNADFVSLVLQVRDTEGTSGLAIKRVWSQQGSARSLVGTSTLAGANSVDHFVGGHQINGPGGADTPAFTEDDTPERCKVLEPAEYHQGDTVDLVIWCHGTTGSAYIPSTGDDDNAAPHALCDDHGMLVAIPDFGNNNLTSLDPMRFAHWGNSDAMASAADWWAWLNNRYTIGKVCVIGTSMGGATGLNMIHRGVVPADGFYGIYAVCSLWDVYQTRSNNDLADAYGLATDQSDNEATVNAGTDGYDPLRADGVDYAGVKFRFSASAGDTVISKAGNTTAMISKLTTDGLSATELSGPTGDHGDASHFDTADIATFVASL